MTLDEFLHALENLIEDRETRDDDPGEGNFGCEDCRACNHCRFCIGCDSCEDCTYCEECIDCTSCTQSKRCVSCQKVSYCEDSRDCKDSRYLTLCVSCTDCVHCLACVGLDGAEFYVLNEKRTRKQYFALLRQIQETMAQRMNGGWRPPGIGLASEIFDAVVAGRDAELTTAPWLDELGVGGELEPVRDEYRDEPPLDYGDRGAGRARDDWGQGRGAGSSRRDDYGRDDYGRDYDRPASPTARRGAAHEAEPRHAREPGRDDDAWAARHDDSVLPRRDDPGYSRRDDPGLPRRGEAVPARREPARDWVREPPAFGSYPDEREREPSRQLGHDDYGRPRPRPEYGSDLGLELGPDDDWSRGSGYEREPRRGRDAGFGREPELGRDAGFGRDEDLGRERPHSRRDAQFDRATDYGRELGHGRDSDYREVGRDAGRGRGDYERGAGYERDTGYDREPDYDEDDVPQHHEHHPTRPFARRREPGYDPSPPANAVADHDHDHRSRFAAEDDLRGLELPPEDDAPAERDREPSSPWLDDNPTQARRRAKRGSLRRAGRPKRPPEGAGAPEATGTGSYRTGSAPERSGSEGTHTGTGLRLGRRPTRRRGG